MIAHGLHLDYALAPGWMAPFVDGLRQGRAMARRCAACMRVSFPPQRTCACGHGAGDWTRLSGRAGLRYRTGGQDGDFALVRFDGADCDSVVRLDPGFAGDAGWLRPATGPMPQMMLGAAEAKERQ